MARLCALSQNTDYYTRSRALDGIRCLEPSRTLDVETVFSALHCSLRCRERIPRETSKYSFAESGRCARRDTTRPLRNIERRPATEEAARYDRFSRRRHCGSHVLHERKRSVPETRIGASEGNWAHREAKVPDYRNHRGPQFLFQV